MKQKFIVTFTIGFDTDINSSWTEQRVSDLITGELVNMEDGVGIDTFEMGKVVKLPDRPTRPSECPTCGGTSSFCPYKYGG